MTVKELIAKLQKMPKDSYVYVYDSVGEGHDGATDVTLVSNEDDEAYDKGDTPSYENPDVFPYVRVGGN